MAFRLKELDTYTYKTNFSNLGEEIEHIDAKGNGLWGILAVCTDKAGNRLSNKQIAGTLERYKLTMSAKNQVDYDSDFVQSDDEYKNHREYEKNMPEGKGYFLIPFYERRKPVIDGYTLLGQPNIVAGQDQFVLGYGTLANGFIDDEVKHILKIREVVEEGFGIGEADGQLYKIKLYGLIGQPRDMKLYKFTDFENLEVTHTNNQEETYNLRVPYRHEAQRVRSIHRMFISNKANIVEGRLEVREFGASRNKVIYDINPELIDYQLRLQGYKPEAFPDHLILDPTAMQKINSAFGLVDDLPNGQLRRKYQRVELVLKYKDIPDDGKIQPKISYELIREWNGNP